MADRTCARCGKVFKYPCHLRRHEANKTPCAPINGDGGKAPKPAEGVAVRMFRCEHCGRGFRSYNGLWKHKKRSCPIIKAREKETQEELRERLYLAQIKKIERLEHEQTRLRQQLSVGGGGGGAAAAAPTVQAVINGDHNNTTIVNQDNRSFVFQIFGKLDLDSITRDDVKAIFDRALEAHGGPNKQAAAFIVKQIAGLVYGGQEGHPERTVCFMKNKREDEAMVHTEDGWDIRSAESIMPVMTTTSINQAFDKQPLAVSDPYNQLLHLIVLYEKLFVGSDLFRDILVRNKKKVMEVLHRLPHLGERFVAAATAAAAAEAGGGGAAAAEPDPE